MTDNPAPIPLPLDAETPLVAVSFTDDADGATVSSACAASVDVAELRIDRFASTDPGHVVTVAERFVSMPTIATIRSRTEGGDFDGDESERRSLFEAVAPHVSAIDVELAATGSLGDVVAAARARGTTTILSCHDFDGTPDDDALGSTIQLARDAGADLVKIATMVHSTADLRTLTRVLCDDHGVGLVVIGMGKLGASSRVLFPVLGSRLTFASWGAPSAPGQMPFDETATLLHRLSPAYAERHPVPTR